MGFISNTLAYPAGVAPGFDPTHPAAAASMGYGHGFSGIASSGGITNILTGKSGTLVGAPTAKVLAMGPTINFGGGASTDAVTFAGQSTINDTAITLAGIVVMDTNAGTTQSIIQNDFGSASGVGIRNNTGALQFYASSLGSNLSPFFCFVVGVPTFFAVSVSGSLGTANFLSKRLDTGAVLTSSTTLAYSITRAPNGTYVVGNSTSANQGCGGSIGAVMFAPTFMSGQQLLKWADDPWSFWYPNANYFLQGI